MIRNASGQSIGAQMVNATTGAAFTGAVTVYITIDAGAQAIGSVGSGLCAHEGNGYHTYLPSDVETDGALIAFTFIGTGAIPRTIQVATVTPAQQSALQAATGALAVTILDIVSDALIEIGVINAVDPPSGEDAEYCVRKLNSILDDWNGERNAVYADTITTYALTPSLQPHTIGPTGTFVVVSRPETIDGMSLVRSGTRTPIYVRDAAWWMGVIDHTWTTELPTDAYYEPAWPNGKLWLWGIPSSAASVEVRTRVVLTQVLVTDTFYMPPGYRSALTLTLAEALAAPFKQPLSPETQRQASKARARLFGTHSVIPRLCTMDPGMPSGRGSTFDYRSGRVN